MPSLSTVFATILVAFLFVLPIPGTIALRHLLMVTMFGFSIYFWHKNLLKIEFNGPTKLLLLFLLLMTAWIVAHTVLIAESPAVVWREILSQWVPALIATLIGILGCKYLQQQRFGNGVIMTVISGALLIQVLFSLLITTPEFLSTGSYPQVKTNWTAGKLEISYWNNLAFAFVAVDLLFRRLFDQKLTSFKTGLLWGAALLLITSNLVFGARNGVIGSSLLLLSMFGLLVFQSGKTERKKLLLAFVLVKVSLILIIILGYISDVRWQVFRETAQKAWAIQEHKAWYSPSGSLPVMPDGRGVDESAYLRIAWMRAGAEWIKANPLGWGFSRNAFGHAMLQISPESRIGHSHSGWVDLGVGLGVPGLLLWLCFSVGLIVIGAKNYLKYRDPAALVLLFVVAGFNGRMLLDSVNKDHMFIVFFLILGFLVASINRIRPEESTSPLI